MIKERTAPHIIEIVETLQNAGFETYIVGGAVRDLKLNRQPKDYDISTSATPEEVKRVFGKRRAFIIGRRFRLVHLMHGSETIEISTFRTAPSKDNQNIRPRENPLPENMIFHDNEFGSAEEDAWRRDFTVNALFFDPVKDEIIDHTGMGLDDLNNRRVRAIGNPQLRFEEDPVRLLRALKLVGQYGFTLEEETRKALVSSIDLITRASSSRLSLELEKILKNPYSDKILEAFYEYGFLIYFLPYLHSKWETAPGKHMQKLLAQRNKHILEGKYRESISLAMAAICLPFVEDTFGKKHTGDLWENYRGIEPEVRHLIVKIFYPLATTRKLVAAARRTLLIQPRFQQMKKNKRLLNHPGYSHGRELFIIQNEVIWKNPEIDEFWPEGNGGIPFKGHHQKRRNKKRTWKRKPSNKH